MTLRTKLVSWVAFAVVLSVPAVPAIFGYALEGPKWPGSAIPMVVQVGTPNFVLPDGFVTWNADAENAFAQWNEQLGTIQFTWTEAATGSAAANHDGVNQVLFSGGAYTYSFGSSTLAVTMLNFSGGTMTETDVLFNTSNGFTSGATVTPSKDFHRVALHEFGHVLGLDHPDQAHPAQDQLCIMHSTVSGLNHLTDDDVAGVVFLYGAPPNPPPLFGNGRLANISTRARTGTGENVLIAGFVVRDQAKQLLIRGLGPTLASFGISNPIPNPNLVLYNANGGAIVSNDNWHDSQGAAIQQTGLQPPDDLESAILITLQPANYTAILSDNGGNTAVGLVEVYDLQTNSGRASNISTRGQVSGGDNVMIAGFAVQGPQLKGVVMRGLGPGLQGFVSSPLPDSTIELRNSTGALIKSNTGWQNDPNSVLITSNHLQPPNVNDSALYDQLAPGNYTVILKSPTNATGVGLIEVYDVDQ